MFDRDKVIESLIADEVELDSLFVSGNNLDSLHHYVCMDYFSNIMKTGFKGYDNYTDEELMKECEERDISYLFGDDD